MVASSAKISRPRRWLALACNSAGARADRLGESLDLRCSFSPRGFCPRRSNFLHRSRLDGRCGGKGKPLSAGLPAGIKQTMTLHLIKLCVGAESVADLRAWTKMRQVARRGRPRPCHEDDSQAARTARRRLALLGDQGPDFRASETGRRRTFVNSAGVKRCALQLDDEVIALRPRPHRAFQGWRYSTDRSPARPGSAGAAAEMPEALRRELSALRLL